MMRNFLIKFARRQHGNAMIELSLILPILVLMLLGALDVGFLIQQSMVVADSAAQGAEYPAAKWDFASDITNMQDFAIAIANANHIPNYSAAAVIVCTCGSGGSGVSCSGTCAGGIQPAQYAQVTATAQLPLLFGVTGLPGSISVQSAARVRVAWRGGQ